MDYFDARRVVNPGCRRVLRSHKHAERLKEALDISLRGFKSEPRVGLRTFCVRVSFIIKPLASLPDVRLALTIFASKQLSCFRKSKFSLLAGVASRAQLCKESVEPSSLLSKDRSILLQKNIVSLLKGFVPKPPRLFYDP